jgi:hypothetical protein
MAKARKKLSDEMAALLVPKKKENPAARALQLKDALTRHNVIHNRKKRWAGEFKQRYEETNNPLALWDCYMHARKIGEPVPEFVLEYLDRVAGNLLNVDNDIKTAGRCLELKANKSGKQGGHSAFTQYDDYLTRRAAVFAVYQKLESQPKLSVMKACKKVAEKCPLAGNGETVFQWYKQINL